jgi:hypothetical protein
MLSPAYASMSARPGTVRAILPASSHGTIVVDLPSAPIRTSDWPLLEPPRQERCATANVPVALGFNQPMFTFDDRT